MTQPTHSPSTAPTPPTALAQRAAPLAGVVMVLFFVVAAASCAWLLIKGSTPFLPDVATRDQVLQGDITHRFAKTLSNAPVPSQAATLERDASWLLFGDLGPRVRQGCPGWLFLTDELRLNPAAMANARAKAQAVVSLQQALAKRGIRLLVAVVPDKSRIAARQLCTLARPASLAPRIVEWLAVLQAAGIAAVDLTPALHPLGDAAYLRTDTHWSEAGARAAAERVAQAVQGIGFKPTPQQAFDLMPQANARRPGDLVHLAGIDGLPVSLQPRPEYVAATQASASAQASGDNLDDLFGDDHLPNTALIGTSFSHNSNFLGFLQHALNAPVGSFAKDGGEFSGAAKAYFGSPAFTRTPPALIIWELPERDLQTPYDQGVQLP
ncbi:cell division protein FtsQ [Pseudomonas silvicola]|nr:cell division protein FtsQ [Pseudomonas silvicola]